MIINGKNYRIPELNFNTMCQLEDMGLSLTQMDKKVLGTVRAFLALAMNGDYERAGTEIEAHLVNGGELDGMMEEVNEAVQSSGFFQALLKNHKTGNRESKSKETEKAAE